MEVSAKNPLQPTYYDFVETEQGATMLFDACSIGALSLTPREPKYVEVLKLIRSGCFFIYSQNVLQSWTDGICWDPVDIDCSFRLEREPGNIVGLFKKTITNEDCHMVSYYTPADFLAGWLKTPSQDSELCLAPSWISSF